MILRRWATALLLSVVPLLGCGGGGETPEAPVSEEEVEDLELDLDSGVEATPEEATSATDADSESE